MECTDCEEDQDDEIDSWRSGKNLELTRHEFNVAVQRIENCSVQQNNKKKGRCQAYSTNEKQNNNRRKRGRDCEKNNKINKVADDTACV